MTLHLAQINVARALAPLDSPVMAGFAAQIAEMNALADASPGFVWRLQDDSGNSSSIVAFDDPLVLVNMSVWTSIEALHAFVYKSRHVGPVRDRKKWFARYDGPYYALWWIEAGHIPTVEEGKARLEDLARNGPSERAFWFVERRDPTSERTRVDGVD